MTCAGQFHFNYVTIRYGERAGRWAARRLRRTQIRHDNRWYDMGRSVCGCAIEPEPFDAAPASARRKIRIARAGSEACRAKAFDWPFPRVASEGSVANEGLDACRVATPSVARLRTPDTNTTRVGRALWVRAGTKSVAVDRHQFAIAYRTNIKNERKIEMGGGDGRGA